MLASVNRLKKKKDFEKIFKEGTGYKENFLYLKIKKSNQETTRFGFIVSKKFSAKSTVRNKIKRMLREIIRINLPHIRRGIDGVIVIMPGFKINNFWELEEIIRKLLKKSGVLKNITPKIKLR